MNESIKERMSALIDGELSEFEVRRVLEEIESNQELREYWTRLQIIRAGLKDESLNLLDKDISVRVATELGQASKNVLKSNKSLLQNKLYLVSATAFGVILVLFIGFLTPFDSNLTPEETFASEASKKIAEAIASPEAIQVLDKAVSGMKVTLQEMNSAKKGQIYANYKVPSNGKTFRVSLSPLSMSPPDLGNSDSAKLAYLKTKEGVFLVPVSGDISPEKKAQILRNVNFSLDKLK